MPALSRPTAVLLALASLAAGAQPTERFTGLRGRVTDRASGEALIEATVKLLGPPLTQALTDIDGNYELPLPPGTYDLRVFYDVYQARRISQVVVSADKVTRLDVQLSADKGAVQEVVVEARLDRKAEGALLEERRRATVVSDGLSAQEMARTPDASASDAVKRVVSATVVEGKYVLLRGLGGRYSVTLLNGALLPSPEPDEQAVPLDVFPTSLLSNMRVLKSYSPELPGTFAGGALLIETNGYPQTLEIKPRLSLSADTQATFRPRHAAPRGSLDALGFDDGARRLPTEVPTDRPLLATPGGLSASQVEAISESFPNRWTASQTRALPNGGVGLSVGNTIGLGSSSLGYLASVAYGHREDVQRARVAQVQGAEGGGFEVRESANTEVGSETGALNALASVGLKVTPTQEISLLSLFTHAGESAAQRVNGVDPAGIGYRGQRLQFIRRTMTFNQLKGAHRLPGLDALDLEWQANVAVQQRHEPDTRDLSYEQIEAGGGERYKTDPGAERYHGQLDQRSGGASLLLTYPASHVKLTAGAMTQVTARELAARRFRYVYSGGDPDVLRLPPEQLFAAENLGRYLELQERTLPEDTYHARLGLYAGHGSAEISLAESLRLVAGLRYEVSEQTLASGSPYALARPTSPNSAQRYGDLLPAASLTWAATAHFNLRSAYSYTLARPTFRELAPFLYFDFQRRRSTSGNPALRETRIHNADLRAEWLGRAEDVLAASLFYKAFRDPIERVTTSAFQGDVSFENARGARSYGAELEARASLSRLSPALAGFRAGANVTVLQSRVELGERASLQTSSRRPLQGQSPYVVNASVGYLHPGSRTEISALYNVSGPRIAEVGFDGTPDLYERAFHQLDLAVSVPLSAGALLKLAASNLLDQPVVVEQGGLTTFTFRPGVAFAASLQLTF